jgi:hypothetical protein
VTLQDHKFHPLSTVWRITKLSGTVNANVSLFWAQRKQQFQSASARVGQYVFQPTPGPLERPLQVARPLYQIAKQGNYFTNHLCRRKSFVTATQPIGPLCTSQSFTLNYKAVGGFNSSTFAQLSDKFGNLIFPHRILVPLHQMYQGQSPAPYLDIYLQDPVRGIGSE